MEGSSSAIDINKVKKLGVNVFISIRLRDIILG
jgi:hypothetical protein